MSFKKKESFTTLDQAKDHVISFKNTFWLFEEHVVINQKSWPLLISYGRSIAYVVIKKHKNEDQTLTRFLK